MYSWTHVSNDHQVKTISALNIYKYGIKKQKTNSLLGAKPKVGGASLLFARLKEASVHENLREKGMALTFLHLKD